MVHLQAVRLRGFKTFAKPTELLLEPGVTVIIGPNGSGKSNLADAVLWVLGEQSPGNLRGRTMQDVMFTGADGKRSSAVAEVSLVFNNGSGALPFDCAELEVTRRLTRETGSEYRLNGSGCRLLDIQDVMGALGLGREMHSVVGQGRVESLLNSSPEYRRAMVEEAAGLGRYKKRRERARSKLERTGQNLLRAQDVEEEVRSAMRPLKQQVAAAERFAEATEEWAGAQARLMLHSLMEVVDSCGRTGAELQEIESALADVGRRLAEIRQQRTVEEEGLSSALKERERLGGLYHRVRGEAEYMQGRTTSLRQRLARAEADLDRAIRRRDLAKSEFASLLGRLAGVSPGTADETRLARVARWSEMLRSALEEATPAYQEKSRGEDDLKDTVFELEAARSRALQDREFLRREGEERSRLFSELSGLLSQSQARVEQLQVEAAGSAGAVAEAEEAVRAAESALRSAEVDREKARTAAGEASVSERALGEALAAAESRRRVLEGIMERKEGLSAGTRRLLAGESEYRVLTDLLTVEAGYERAVATALGPIIHAVVVPGYLEPGEVLQNTDGPIEVMKEVAIAGAGRSPRATPGIRDLWEVISGPEPVMRALRALVPTTLVVEETGGLSKGAKYATRVVSRGGELVEPGLYAARREELAAEGLLAAGKDLETVKREQEALYAQRANAAEKAENAAAEVLQAELGLRQSEERLRECEHRLAEKRSEAELCTRRLEESASQSEELRERVARERQLAEEASEQLRAIEESTAAKESALEQARASLRELQTDIESMRLKVAALEEKKSQAALVEVRLRERCRTILAERSRIEGQRESAAREVGRWERRVEFLEGYAPVLAELLRATERLAERGNSVAEELERQVAATREQTEGSARVMRDWGSAEIGLQREYDLMTTRLTEVRVEHARLEDRRRQLEEEVAELRRRHLSPRTLTEADVAGTERNSLAAAVERAERRRERIGPINPLAEQEYAQMEERARFLAEQRGDLETAVTQLQEVIAGLDEHIEQSFNEIFEAAKAHFAAVISVVFPGAKGTLRLTKCRAGIRAVPELEEEADGEAGEEALNPTAGGVMLEVKFANKAPRSLSLLSGGEKAMTAIAFLFSLFLARPCPFYILDEVEASLDDLNIRRFLSLVHKYRDKTQFIIITHQRQTMEVADTLYGVSLDNEGTSRVLSRRMKVAKGA